MCVCVCVCVSNKIWKQAVVVEGKGCGGEREKCFLVFNG